MSLVDERRRKMKKRFTRIVMSMLLIVSMLTGILPPQSMEAEAKNGEEANVDSVIAYFVDVGDKDPATINTGDKFGVNNSVTDQIYGEDPGTGKIWGVNEATEATALSNYEDGMDKKLSFRCGVTDNNVIYKFELSEGVYDIEVGIPHYPWGPRIVDVMVTEGENTQQIASEIKTAEIPEGDVQVVGDVLEATGTEVTLEVTKNPSSSWDPLVSYIIIYDRAAAKEEVDALLVNAKSYSSADYTEESYGNLEIAIQNAESIDLQADTTNYICTVRDELQAAMDALVRKTLRENVDPVIAYFVDAGAYDPTVLNGNDKFGTYNSVVDQAYGVDSGTGYSWGYKGETVKFHNTVEGMTKEESSRFGASSWDFGYTFTLAEGMYDVEIYIPNENSARVFDIYATDKNGENKLTSSSIQAGDGPFTLDYTIESSGLDSEVVIDFRKPDSTYWDPVVSYIIIYDIQAATQAFEALITEAEGYQAEGYREDSYQVLQEAIAAAKAVNVSELEFQGKGAKAEIVKLQAAIDNLIIANHYFVSFAAAEKTGGTIPEGSYVEAGAEYVIPSSSLTRTGYVFEGWSYGGTTYQAGQSITMPSGDIVLTAVWEKTYKITFAKGGGAGTLPANIVDKAGTTVTLPDSSLSKIDYTFAGWNDGTATYQAGTEFVIPSSDVTLTAVWEANRTYTISFANGGGTGTLPSDIVSEADNPVTLPDSSLSRNGYTFVGWSDGTTTYQAGDILMMPAADMVLTAVWKAEPIVVKTYTVQFASSGGSKVQNQQVKEGQKAVMPKNPTRKDYNFTGWYNGSQKYNFSSAVTGDLKLTAKWKKVTVAKATLLKVTNKKGKKASLKIKKVSGAKGYQVLYALDKKFKKGKKQISFKKTTKTITKLKKGKTYYFKVRAYKLDSTGKKVYGKYSNYRKLLNIK